ncbi:Protein of unknown function (DUF3558) [Streptoalloteichus tenebrarius]|uniref:DUF3558 domain-containing protein n=1 Tax=Streptoalloteichus tenebrarius (strain ATCC 17920 / DSM 40477 / JCM 4838 / CBS 697.72 / NBRC 16177 / NCIMB 11028 / NRRL B-12390 / A12253. 1 / ISP 5477) TaxID=1933 RepID=A0ABT1HY56_STRSD|nr:Protein of unknown function (DUF3558) [Streptoalloteichus tenebrarius]BFF02753.1 hypothetical protein GCM10020241_44280 [Streptoalloteichus tenebrarius]
MLAVLLVAATAGCTWASSSARSDGTPRVADPPLPATTTLPRSPRPTEIPLDTVDPCGVLTPDQRRQLSLDGTPTPYADSRFANARACSLRDGAHGLVARLAVVTDQGIEVWHDDTAQVDAEGVQVNGFPALVVRTPGQETFCNVEVDMADGQFLDVLLRDGGNQKPPPRDELCRGARRIAEAAVASLRATR